MRLALITPSYSRDLPLCAELCRSVDIHNVQRIEHVIVVPRRELGLFAPLASPVRRIVAKEDVLPPGMRHVPFPPVIGIPGVYAKRLRSLWLTAGLRPVRGWILQQVVKLSADRITDAEGYVFLDSDIVMVRPFTAATFVRDGRLPLHYVPPAAHGHKGARYARWQDVACDLTGLPRFPYAGDDYVATVVCWRRDRLVEVQRRVAAASGTDFQSAILPQQQLSEYFVYGVWCRHGVAGENGHYDQAHSLSHEDWNYDMTTRSGADAFVRGLKAHHIAVLMQSTGDMTIARRRAIVAAVERAAGLP